MNNVSDGIIGQEFGHFFLLNIWPFSRRIRLKTGVFQARQASGRRFSASPRAAVSQNGVKMPFGRCFDRVLANFRFKIWQPKAENSHLFRYSQLFGHLYYLLIFQNSKTKCRNQGRNRAPLMLTAFFVYGTSWGVRKSAQGRPKLFKRGSTM